MKKNNLLKIRKKNQNQILFNDNLNKIETPCECETTQPLRNSDQYQ